MWHRGVHCIGSKCCNAVYPRMPLYPMWYMLVHHMTAFMAYVVYLYTPHGSICVICGLYDMGIPHCNICHMRDAPIPHIRAYLQYTGYPYTPHDFIFCHAGYRDIPHNTLFGVCGIYQVGNSGFAT